MGQVIFGTLNVVGRNQPLLLEETVKNLAAFADLQDADFDNLFDGEGTGWTPNAGVTVIGTGGIPSTDAFWDDYITRYDRGFLYG